MDSSFLCEKTIMFAAVDIDYQDPKAQAAALLFVILAIASSLSSLLRRIPIALGIRPVCKLNRLGTQIGLLA